MPQPTPRVVRLVERDFGADLAPTVLALLADVDAVVGSERVQAAVVLAAHGDVDELLVELDLARLDWRDLLVNADVAHDDWPAVLDRELGRA